MGITGGLDCRSKNVWFVFDWANVGRHSGDVDGGGIGHVDTEVLKMSILEVLDMSIFLWEPHNTRSNTQNTG